MSTPCALNQNIVTNFAAVAFMIIGARTAGTIVTTNSAMTFLDNEVCVCVRVYVCVCECVRVCVWSGSSSV